MKLMMCIISVLVSVSIGLADTVSISTADGALGADALVAGGVGSGTSTFHINNYGGATELILKEGALDWCRKSYTRFDLSGLPQGVVTNARLDLVISRNDVQRATVAVYGLDNGDPGEYWIEGTGSDSGVIATAGEITWDNAPANNTNSANLLLSNAVLLGSISVNSNAVGSVISLDNKALADFIQADTNGVATIILTRSWSANSSQHLRFHTKENNSGYEPPTLSLVVDSGAQYITTRADAYIRGAQYNTNNYGHVTSLALKGSGGPEYNRKTYLGFELPDMSKKDVAEAGFCVEISSCDATTPLNVWGLKETSSADNWVEGDGGVNTNQTGEITWNNAPGVINSGYNVDMDSDEVVFLGTLPILDAVAGDILWFESDAMRDFIADDEDGLVTIILQSVQDSAVGIKSKEDTNAVMPPTMRLVLAPARGTLILVQ